MRRLRRLTIRDRGQTLMEFAIVMPIVFLFLVMIVDFGVALDHRLALEHAVREGARYGAVNGGDINAIKQRAVAEARASSPPPT